MLSVTIYLLITTIKPVINEYFYSWTLHLLHQKKFLDSTKILFILQNQKEKKKMQRLLEVNLDVGVS